MGCVPNGSNGSRMAPPNGSTPSAAREKAGYPKLDQQYPCLILAIKLPQQQWAEYSQKIIPVDKSPHLIYTEIQSQNRNEAQGFGIELKVFTKSEINIALKIRHVDAVVIFTNKVSHKTKREVMNIAKAKNIPVFMYHSCGICTLRDCFNCLKNKKGGAKNA